MGKYVYDECILWTLRGSLIQCVCRVSASVGNKFQPSSVRILQRFLDFFVQDELKTRPDLVWLKTVNEAGPRGRYLIGTV